MAEPWLKPMLRRLPQWHRHARVDLYSKSPGQQDPAWRRSSNGNMTAGRCSPASSLQEDCHPGSGV